MLPHGQCEAAMCAVWGGGEAGQVGKQQLSGAAPATGRRMAHWTLGHQPRHGWTQYTRGGQYCTTSFF